MEEMPKPEDELFRSELERLPKQVDQIYDAGATGCGELIMNIFMKVKRMSTGQVIKVISYDLGAREDIPAWCRLQGHCLLGTEQEGKITHYYIQKN